MTQIIFLLPGGGQQAVEAEDGESLMEAARREDLPGIVAECGGSCACATCHVYVDERYMGEVDPLEDFESDMLDGVTAPRRGESRLSCQIRVKPTLSGMVVTIPA
jgi:2Fe-2S ferredoxin